MPKKIPRNAFYFFMVDFKEEQRKKGIHYANMKEVADAAGPEWTKARPSVRTKYQEIAKNHKEQLSGPENKFTSLGIPIAEIERQEKAKRDAEEFERNDINNMIQLKLYDSRIIDSEFYLIDVNSYCLAGTEYFIGEFTIIKFSLQDGIKDNYHEVINPGYTPIGYGYDVKCGCEELGLDPPDEEKPQSNYMKILANIIDYLKQTNRQGQSLPPLYTVVDKLREVQSFIYQLCDNAAEDMSLFRIYRLDTMYYTLINAIKARPNEGFPKESLATTQLAKDVFRYSPGLGCEHHESGDKSIHCTMSRVKRWAFTILDRCCPIVGVEVEAGKHLPAEYDVEGIITLKQEKKSQMDTASVAKPSSSSKSSLVSEPVAESSVSRFASPVTGSVKKEKRSHEPLRMPRDNCWFATGPTPPSLSNENFPHLPSLNSSGVGRGRGVTKNMANLSLK